MRSSPRASSGARSLQTWAPRAGEHSRTRAGLLRRSDTKTCSHTHSLSHTQWSTLAPSAHRERNRTGCKDGFKLRPESNWSDVILTEHVWLRQVTSLESRVHPDPQSGTFHRTHLRLPAQRPQNIHEALENMGHVGTTGFSLVTNAVALATSWMNMSKILK